MLNIEIVSRENLSHVLERRTITHYDPDLRISALMGQECPAFRQDIAEKSYISLYLDGVKIPQKLWPQVRIGPARRMLIVLEAGGITATAVMAIISVVMAVASAVYAIISMNKLGRATAADTRKGSSIYDVNAQGNQVNLTNVIPETFGHFKRFPDYLADKHIFYRQNKLFLDMILCQGRGYYQRAADHSDIYIGETPINTLAECEVSIFDPGTVITAENSIEDQCWYCYYSSTEVTQSGHTLKPAVTEIDQSGQDDASAVFAGDTFSGGYYTYQQITGGTQGPGSMRIYHPLDLSWDAGAVFTISGAVDIRLIGESDTLTDDAVTGLTSITAQLAAYFLADNEALHKAWLRARVTDADDQVVSSGDLLNVIVTSRTTVSYSIRSGTGGVEIRSVYNDASIVSQAELMGVTYSGNTATLVFDSAEINAGSYPAAPAVPAGAYNTSTSYSRIITIEQPVPADYTHGGDDGLYQIESVADHVYTVSRLSSSYAPLLNWVEFWSQGYTQTNLSFQLDSSSDTGGYVGPYRACPYGAEAGIFEYDIKFPQGLGYLQDNGTFRDLTVTIEIGYRPAGSSAAWTTVEREFTAHTNDELAYTYKIEISPAGNYEFRMRNLTESSNNTRALEEVVWVGLKSVISTVNRYDEMTVLICRFRGSETLSELSENQIATYWTRRLPDIVTGDLIPTSDIAPAVKYVISNSKYQGIIDNTALLEYNAFWRGRGLELNGTLDSDSTLLDVLRDMLSAGFAAPVIRDNQLSFARLHVKGENEPLAQVFGPQNLLSSPEITFNLPKDDDTDEVVVEYISPETYKTETLFCHVDSNGDKRITMYPESVHQEKLRAFGVTSRAHAEAMGMRRLRYLMNTRVTYKIRTELDGLNCQYNDLVGLFLDEDMSGITGRMTAWDDTGLIATIDAEIPRDRTSGIIYIRRKDGVPINRTYTRLTSHTVALDSGIFEWDDRYGEDLEYPFIAIGDMVMCWVTAVNPQEKTCELTLINYSADIFIDDIIPSEGYGISPYGIAPYGEPM